MCKMPGCWNAGMLGCLDAWVQQRNISGAIPSSSSLAIQMSCRWQMAVNEINEWEELGRTGGTKRCTRQACHHASYNHQSINKSTIQPPNLHLPRLLSSLLLPSSSSRSSSSRVPPFVRSCSPGECMESEALAPNATKHQ
jgi:hypothetical protein